MRCHRHRIAFGRRREDGFVTIFVLMLAVVLLSLLGVAAHEMALAYAQNRVERQAIEQRAKTLDSPSRAPTLLPQNVTTK